MRPYYRVPPPRPGLLLGYAGLGTGQLRAAVEILGRCLHEPWPEGDTPEPAEDPDE